MGGRQARVTAAYATVEIMDAASGKPTVYGFYEGAILPPSANPESVARLVRREYAEWVDTEPVPEPEKQADDKAETAKKAAPVKKAG